MDDIENSKQATSIPPSTGFQHPDHQIPTLGDENPKPPRLEPFVFNPWLVLGVCVFMVCLGIALQVALYISQAQNGFPVFEKKIFSFSSAQFLTSFLPTLFVIPIVSFWSSSDSLLRSYQPYVTMSQEKVSASQSILLDYVSLSQWDTLYNSWTYKHYLISVSALIVLASTIVQPLAGSLLQVRQIPHTTDSTAFLMEDIGLSPTINNLDGFFASTGFALASVYGNLVDPPFVHGIWAAGQFQPPPAVSYLNGTLAVNTTAIQTEVNCISPTSLNTTNIGGSYLVSASFPNGCSASNTFNPVNGTQQFTVVNAGNCAAQGLSIEFQPVVFWYYLNTSSPQVASVYCNPTMNVFQVQTSMNLTTAALGPCTIIVPTQGTNNVTGSPQNGRPYNGVMFNSSSDFYTSSRSQAISFGIPDAIYRYASRQPGGPLSVFQDPYGFLNATNLIYTQHLSVAAQTNYFLKVNSTIPAKLTTNIPRVFVEPAPALALSPLFIIMGVVGFVLHFLHRRARSGLWLTSPPGSIASIVSLTSHSGFGGLLLPYDDERRMENNLAGLRFRMDRRTGAVVAEEDHGLAETSDGMALLEREVRYNDSITHLSP